jgi:hypothetical protein
MKTLTSLSLIAALSCFSLHANAATQTFPMELTAKGHAYIRANLNQLESYPMVLDTAAQTGLLPQSILPLLKLDDKALSTDQAVGATGAVQMQTATLGSTVVGSFEHKDLNYLVRDMVKLTLPDGKMPGILGHDFLQHYCVDLNFKEAIVSLNKGACDAAAVAGLQATPFKVEDDFVRLTAQVQGVTTAVLLDTGAHHSFINTPLYKQLSGLTISGTEQTGGMTGHTQDRQVLAGLSYQLNGHTVKEARSYLADMHVFKHLGYADKPFMLLGINAFKNGRMVLDYANNTLYFRQ